MNKINITHNLQSLSNLTYVIQLQIDRYLQSCNSGQTSNIVQDGSKMWAEVGLCKWWLDQHIKRRLSGNLPNRRPPAHGIFVDRCAIYSCCGQKRYPELLTTCIVYPVSPKLKNVYLRRDQLDRTDDFDVFELLGQHIRKESTDWSSPHTSLVRSVPSANLLQLCRIEAPFNRINREEEDGNLTKTQL